MYRAHCKHTSDEEKRGCDRKGKQEERRTSQSEANLGEVWKVALFPFAFGAELVMCQRCGGWTAEKDGGDGCSRKFTKVETAKRRRQG